MNEMGMEAMDRRGSMDKSKEGKALILTSAITAIALGIIILSAVFLTKRTIERRVSAEPIRAFVTDRQCQFVRQPVQSGMWAACNDGTVWGVVPLEAGRPQQP